MEISVLSTVNLFKPNDCCFPVSIYWYMRYLTERAESEFYFVFDLSCLSRIFLVARNAQILDVYGILSVFDLGSWKFGHVNERLFIRNSFWRLRWILLIFSQKQILEIDLRALSTLDLHLVLSLYSLLLQSIFELEQLQLPIFSLLNLKWRIYFLRFIQLPRLLQLTKYANSALKMSKLLINLLASYRCLLLCRNLAALIIQLLVVPLSAFLHSYLVLLRLFNLALLHLLPFKVSLRLQGLLISIWILF